MKYHEYFRHSNNIQINMNCSLLMRSYRKRKLFDFHFNFENREEATFQLFVVKCKYNAMYECIIITIARKSKPRKIIHFGATKQTENVQNFNCKLQFFAKFTIFAFCHIKTRHFFPIHLIK